MSSSSSECGLCLKLTSGTCSKCNKISYCSLECEDKDEISHKEQCFPLRVESSQILGRYFVATKDIQQWDLVLEEKPIISGPNDMDREGICLGCFAILEEPYHYNCSSCKWPVCNSTCEKMVGHANFECGVFSKHSIEFCLTSSMYRQIHVLRCLLLKDSDPMKWKHIMSMESHAQTKRETSGGMTKSEDCVEFIRDHCKLSQFAPQEIDHVLGALDTNTFGVENCLAGQDKQRSGANLYNLASVAAHSCVPNCYRLIDDNSVYQLRACVDIPAGTPVTTFYVDTWIPTQERQSILRSNYFFTCTCTRCVDPTELDTYFSGVKCSEVNEDSCGGYVIPILPTAPSGDSDSDIEWECTTCKTKTEDRFIQQFNDEFDSVIGNVPELYSLENFELLDEIAKSYQDKVHMNHYRLVDLEYDIVDRIHDLLLTSAPSDGVIQHQNMLNRLLTICRHQLQVADVIRPGWSVFRGKILHIFQYGLMAKLLHTHSGERNCDKLELEEEMEEIELMRATALRILSVEPGQDSRRIVDGLRNVSEEVLAWKLAMGLRV